jgi:hypothetical protein
MTEQVLHHMEPILNFRGHALLEVRERFEPVSQLVAGEHLTFGHFTPEMQSEGLFLGSLRVFQRLDSPAKLPIARMS